MSQGPTKARLGRSGTAILLLSLILGARAMAGAPKLSTGSAKRTPGTSQTVRLGGGVLMEFVWCPPGSFMMGSSSNQQASAINALPRDLSPNTGKSTVAAIHSEGPQHRVILPNGFWMAKTEVTQSQWAQVMGNNPSKFKAAGSNAPVETVSWNDCQAFIARLNATLMKQMPGVRLPSEAEWEYACRAGAQTAYYFGDDAAKLGDYAWHSKNSGLTSHPVAEKRPNAWGLHDMHGNVWEWCADCYGKYPADAVQNPVGPAMGPGRVGRGGGWDDLAEDCRAAYRSYGRPADFKASPLGLRPIMMDP